MTYSPDVWKPAFDVLQIFRNPALVVVAAPCENRSIISSLVTKGNLVFLLDIDYWKALILRRFPQWHRQFPSRHHITVIWQIFVWLCLHVFDLGIWYFCRKWVQWRCRRCAAHFFPILMQFFRNIDQIIGYCLHAVWKDLDCSHIMKFSPIFNLKISVHYSV